MRRILAILAMLTILVAASGCDNPCVDKATAATTGVCQWFGYVIAWP